MCEEKKGEGSAGIGARDHENDMPMYITAKVHPCDTVTEGYNMYRLNKANVAKLIAGSPGLVNMWIEHQKDLHVGRWICFDHCADDDTLTAVGVIDDTTPWGRYAIAGILEGVFSEFSITYSHFDDPMETILANGVRKHTMIDVSICVKGAFDNTSLLSYTHELPPFGADDSLPTVAEVENHPSGILPVLRTQRQRRHEAFKHYLGRFLH